ncbi:TIM barrel protein [Paenibacillus sp.]|uniref:sugar phosphate isomerase/epimerase family protein n=1 Tax=Paenibacillus sp. TaxID=58172 RepID=UPI00281117B3|nr:TIM barrel protein [Paenibacillus sp.]
MRLAISNIAWEPSEDKQILEVLRRHKVNCIEVAPTKWWTRPTEVSSDEAKETRMKWSDEGFELVAMQSLLFNRPDLQLFLNQESRKALQLYLEQIMLLASWIGTRKLVFGSPKNRMLSNMHYDEAMDTAVQFFRDIGVFAQNVGVVFCIEPNPPAYGCDFITNTSEGIQLIKSVDHPGVRLHLDAAALTLNHEGVPQSIHAALPYLSHVHLSEPYLNLLNENSSSIKKMIKSLKQHSYDGIVSIEMKAGVKNHNFEAVEHAVSISQAALAEAEAFRGTAGGK